MANNNQIYKMSNAGGFKSLVRYYDMLAGNTTWSPWSPVGSYDSIATSTVGSGGAVSVTFSSIPSTYKHLELRLLLKDTSTGTGGPNVTMTMNGDETYTNYYSHYFGANSSAVSSGYVQANGYLCLTGNLATSNGSYTNMFGSQIISVLDYANTAKYKTVRSLWGHDRNGTGEVGLDSALWKNTSAITSLTFYVVGGASFAQGSQFALYGIK